MVKVCADTLRRIPKAMNRSPALPGLRAGVTGDEDPDASAKATHVLAGDIVAERLVLGRGRGDADGIDASSADPVVGIAMRPGHERGTRKTAPSRSAHAQVGGAGLPPRALPLPISAVVFKRPTARGAIARRRIHRVETLILAVGKVATRAGQAGPHGRRFRSHAPAAAGGAGQAEDVTDRRHRP